MKIRKLISAVLAIIMLLGAFSVPVSAYAQTTNASESTYFTTHQGNPFLPLWEYTPDCEPYVFEDPDNPGQYRVYVYGSHDMMKTGYCGWDLVTWSAPVDDLTTWRYDGVIFESLAGGVADVLYAPDVEEVVDPDTGKKIYYLFPNNQSGPRISQVAVSDRPDGPFETINWANPEQTATIGPLAFDPAVFVDDDGRVYGYWGIRGSEGCELEPNMYELKSGTEIVSPLIPTGDDDFRFFEASSIRKINGTYVMVYARSGHNLANGEAWGGGFGQLGYAWSTESPLGPYTFGGILVDCRGEAIPNAAGNGYNLSMNGSNTHGGLFEIDGQWYITYHRSSHNFARQAMVEPVQMEYNDETGEVKFLPMPGRSSYPEAVDDRVDTDRKPAAEMTSMGFSIDGLDPYRKHSAAIACFMMGSMTSTSNRPNFRPEYDRALNSLAMYNIRNNAVIGYKYFNFDDTAPADKQTQLEIGLQPLGQDATIEVYLREPGLANTQELGEKIGEFVLTADMPQEYTTLRIPVPRVDEDEVSGLQGIFFRFVSPTAGSNNLCELWDLQFVIENNWFEDDFEDGLTYWSLTGDAGVESGALTLSGADAQATNKLGKKWSDYSMQTTVAQLQGTLNLRFRQTDERNYYELAVSQNKLELYSVLYADRTLLQSREFFVGGGPFTLIVDAVSDTLSVRVNKTLVLNAKNGNHEIGTVGFATQEDATASITSVSVGRSVYTPQDVYSEERPVQDSVTVGGAHLPNFSTTVNTYFVEVAQDAPIPQLEASSEYDDVRVTVLQAQEVPGTAIARFLDGGDTRTYYVKFLRPDDEIPRTSESFAALSGLPADWQYFNVSDAAKSNLAFETPGMKFTAPGTVAREDYPSDPGTAEFPHIEMVNPLSGDWEVTVEFESEVEINSANLGGGSYGGYGLGFMTPGGAYVKFMLMNSQSIQMAGTGMPEFNASGAGAGTYHWLRFRKVGNTLTGYRSTDGINFTRHGGYVLDDSFDDARVQLFATTNMGTIDFSMWAKNIWTADLGGLSQVPSDQLDVERALSLIGTSMSIPKGIYTNDAARAAKAAEGLNAREDIQALGVECAVVSSGDHYKLTISKGSSTLDVEPFTVIELLREWVDLQAALDKAAALSEYDYTLATWNKLASALREADKLDEGADGLAINNACLRLEAALSAMEEIEDDTAISVSGVNNGGHTNAEVITVTVEEEIGIETDNITVLKDGRVVAVIVKDDGRYFLTGAAQTQEVPGENADGDPNVDEVDGGQTDAGSSQEEAEEDGLNESDPTGPAQADETEFPAAPEVGGISPVATAKLTMSSGGRFTATLDLREPGFGDGLYRLVADVSGDKYVFEFVSDRTPPEIDFNEATGAVTVTDKNLDTVWLNGVECEASFVITGAGRYVVEAVDKAGNESLVTLIVPTAGSTGGSSTSRSGNGGSSGWSAPATPPAWLDNALTAAIAEVTQTVAVQTTREAVAAAQASGAATATVRLHNPGGISLETLKAMSEQAGEMALVIHADSMSGNAVDVRLRIDPAQASDNLNLAASTGSARATSIKALLENWFGNHLAVACLEQEGAFGQPVQVAVKLDTPLTASEELVIYSYNSTANTYSKLADQTCRVDANGYLHFNVTAGGSYVISSGALTRK